MRHTMGLLLLGVLAWALGPQSARAEIEIDGLKSKPPAHWKEEEPSNRMRFGQFLVPRAQGDERDAELIIFYFGPGSGGTADENIKRWKGMFKPPAGKDIDDVSKVEMFKAGNVPVTYLDVQGSYLEKFPPFAPNAKVTERPDYRMLGVVFESPKGPYFFRLVGPAKTVTENKKAFEDWVKGFK